MGRHKPKFFLLTSQMVFYGGSIPPLGTKFKKMESKVKVVVQFSSGKDSQASLIWAVNKFGKNNVIAEMSDTVWEHSISYQHAIEVCLKLEVELIFLKSERYNGMLDLAIKRKRFPSKKARFCTQVLKIEPFIDWVLNQRNHLLIIQGIRHDESDDRAKMNGECRLFKYYFEPYVTNSSIVDNFSKIENPSLVQRKRYLKAITRLELGKEDPKFHTYRKKEVLEWTKKYDDTLWRPVITWTENEVISYIINNGQKPNPLYYQGSKRVGCFPCIMTNLSELKAMTEFSPEWIEKVREAEKQTNSSFFPPNYIPKKFQSQRDKKGNRFPSVDDVVKYITEYSGNLFENDKDYKESQKCVSFYKICD